MPHFYSPAGEGRVHQCLRFNKDKISERCRNEEMKLAAIEYRDIRLRPKLNKQCSEEKAVYCKVSGAGERKRRRQGPCPSLQTPPRPFPSQACLVIPPQDVKPGKARVVKCLMENMAQPNSPHTSPTLPLPCRTSSPARRVSSSA